MIMIFEELTMGYFKNKIIDVLELLEENNMDFMMVAKKSGLSFNEVLEIAEQYGDFEINSLELAND